MPFWGPMMLPNGPRCVTKADNLSRTQYARWRRCSRINDDCLSGEEFTAAAFWPDFRCPVPRQSPDCSK